MSYILFRVVVRRFICWAGNRFGHFDILDVMAATANMPVPSQTLRAGHFGLLEGTVSLSDVAMREQ